MAQAVEDWLRATPPVTRVFAIACTAATAAVFLDLVSPLDLYLNLRLVTNREVWRLLTNFLFFDYFGINWLFHMFFTIRHSAKLEEVHFRGRTADFLFLYLYGIVSLLLLDALLFWYAPTFKIMFLAPPFSVTIMYVWARRNPHIRMSFLGVFTFNAPYLPWVMVAVGTVMAPPSHAAINAAIDLLGIFVGHTYFFFEDVYPAVSGRRIMRTPGFLRALCGENGDLHEAALLAARAGPQINLAEELEMARRMEERGGGADVAQQVAEAQVEEIDRTYEEKRVRREEEQRAASAAAAARSNSGDASAGAVEGEGGAGAAGAARADSGIRQRTPRSETSETE